MSKIRDRILRGEPATGRWRNWVNGFWRVSRRGWMKRGRRRGGSWMRSRNHTPGTIFSDSIILQEVRPHRTRHAYNTEQIVIVIDSMINSF
jgi:hypothetical protein